MGTVTTAGRTLDRNLSRVDEILQNGNNLFQGAERAYDPTYNWLDLNLPTAPGVTGAYIAGLLRDRLAGICRRIVGQPLRGAVRRAVLATLAQCGNPSSGFFDPLLNDIPTILDTLTGSGGVQHGAGPPAEGTQPDRSGRARPAAARPRPHRRPPARRAEEPRPAPTTTTTTVPPPTTTTTRRAACSASLLGCPGRARARLGQRRQARSARRPRGPALQRRHARRRGCQATATLRRTRSTTPDPTLTAPAATLLPPLPQDQHRHRHPHARRARGLLAGCGPRRGELVLMRRRGPRRLLAVPAALARPRPGARRLLGVRRLASAHGDGRLLRCGRPRQRRPGAVGRRPVGSVTLHRAGRGQGEGHARLRQRRPHPGRRARGHQPHHDPRRPVRRARSCPRRRPVPRPPAAPQLADGAGIAHTSPSPTWSSSSRPGRRSSAPSPPRELEQIIEAGGEGFTGQEASLKAFLTDLTTVATGYAQHTSDITQAVNGLNSLTATLAPTSGATATALDNLVADRGHPGPATRRSSRRCCSPSTTSRPRGAASSRTTTPRS